MFYRATRSVMDLLIAEMIHRMEYDDKTKEPSPCPDRNEEKTGCFSSEGICPYLCSNCPFASHIGEICKGMWGSGIWKGALRVRDRQRAWQGAL